MNLFKSSIKFWLLRSTLLAGSFLFFIGCRAPDPIPDATLNAKQATETAAQHYVSFSMVTQEFIYTTEGIATLHKYIDLHEQYNVPIDVIVDDASMQVYAEKAPELIERLRTSSVVAVSYHVRPPMPYYKKFDFAGLSQLSPEKLEERLLQYEEHGVDLVTGEPRDTAGGYQFVKDSIGYAPIMAGMITESQFAPTLLKIYSDKGAQFVIEHRDEPIGIGEQRGTLQVRPETIPLIFTEYLETPADQLIGDRLAELPSDQPTFLSIKTHDNDFFATQSAWLSIYLNQNQVGTPQPPFDLSVHSQEAELLSQDEQTARWQQYESFVRYASEHRAEFMLINAKNLTAITAADSTKLSEPTNTDDQPPIYVTLVSHNEEPASGRYPNFPEDETAFWEHREAVINFAEAVTAAGAKYNWQSDWAFLEAVHSFDQGTPETNNKNLLQYLNTDLGVAIDPHAHESRYNYADVAYLIQRLGVEPSHVVGGYLASPVSDSKLEYLWEPITSTIDPSYTWQAELLWGGGSPMHVNDYAVSGIWRPAGNDEFLTHSDTAPLPNIGTYSSSWEGVDDLLAKQAAGELTPGEMYTVTVMVGQDEMKDAKVIAETVEQITSLNDEVAVGNLVWVNLQEAYTIWKNEYGSNPNIYQDAAVSKSVTPAAGREEQKNLQNQSNGKCGNGICEPLEKQRNLCTQDC